MIGFRVWVGFAVSGCALSCAEEQRPSAAEVGSLASVVEPLSAHGALDAQMSGADPEVSVEQVVSQMDAVGPTGAADHERRVESLRRQPSPVGKLKDYYESLPPTEVGARWKVIYLARQMRSPHATSWLVDIALSQPRERDSDVGESFRLRYTAAMGVVRSFLAKIPASEPAIERLLENAEPDVAQLVGMELHMAGALGAHWRGKLSARGITTNFRAPTAAELAELYDADPAKGARASLNKGVEPVPVPAESEQ